ncbi:MAG: putative baseplate assembly protein [Candidatus Aminicenantes bacterium]|jgi:predicted phage baseplate assembly protein
MSNQNQILDECGCCEGVKSLTPASLENYPGLSALAYRVGTHGSFKKTMISGLSTRPELGNLTTRENDDPAVALLDAWAAVLDVLSFYQERIVNEGYLRTATERRSILELARHISYQPRPGVAASTYLAFTMETAPGSPLQAKLGAGTRAQSIPGQDEFPQVFETVEEIEAKVAWNELKPRLTQPQEISAAMGSVILQGTAANLEPGDTVLILDDSGNKKPKKILEITIDNDTGTTRIDFDSPSLSPSSYERPDSLPEGSLDDFEDEEELTESAVEKITAKTWNEEVLSALLKIKNWSADELVTNIAEQLASGSDTDASVFAFRNRAAIFGYNAVKLVTYDTGTGCPEPASEWDEWTPTGETGDTMFLDRAYEEVLPGSYIVVQNPDGTTTDFQVDTAATLMRTEYGVSSKTTRIILANDETWWNPLPSPGVDNFDVIRSTSVYVQSEQLETAEVPIEDLVEGDTITLDNAYPGLSAGQRVILTGEREDLKGVYASEIKILEEVILEAGFTVVTFEKTLARKYVRNTVTINANVARATHGESTTEVLGSGDGSKTFQEFQLKQKPLTYVPVTTAAGAETTLGIRVNDILWKEVPFFYGVSAEERVYVTCIADDGTVTVQFGDGITGARLPTGVENVKATYRVGIGPDALVKAGQISLLMTPELGVNGVVNPLAPSGAENPETRDKARQNAPRTVLTLDRVVSIRDYEDFANAYPGIGKAKVALFWKGEQRVVHLTAAAADGGAVSSDLNKNLTDSIDAARHPDHQVRVGSFRPLYFDVKARVLVDSDYIKENVLAAVSEALKKAFSFASRDFGQAVTPSEVTAVIQGVKGVAAVDLEELGGQDPFAWEHFHLPAEAAHWDKNNEEIAAAQLLTVNPDGIELLEMTT